MRYQLSNANHAHINGTNYRRSGDRQNWRLDRGGELDKPGHERVGRSGAAGNKATAYELRADYRGGYSKNLILNQCTEF